MKEILENSIDSMIFIIYILNIKYIIIVIQERRKENEI